MRNGEVAVITQRQDGIAVGCPEGTDQVYMWTWGKTSLREYDLIEQLPIRTTSARPEQSEDARGSNL